MKNANDCMHLSIEGSDMEHFVIHAWMNGRNSEIKECFEDFFPFQFVPSYHNLSNQSL